jgi:tetratricopeptide (TPR) repeat protein
LKKRNNIFSILILFFSLSTFAQNQKIIIDTPVNDTKKEYPKENSENLASAYFKQGITQSIVFQNFNLGVESFTKSIELNPNQSLAYYNRGYAYMKLDQISLAIQDLQKSIELDDLNKRAHLNLGKCYTLINQESKAISEYKKSISIDSNYSPAYYNLGISYDYNEEYQASIENYNRAVMIEPDRSEYYFNRGLVKQKISNLEGALSDFNISAQMNNSDAEVHFAIGFTYLNMGNTVEAKKAFNTTLKKDSTYWDAYFNRALIDLQDLYFADAERDLQIYCENNQADPLGFFYLGKSENDLGDYYKAMDSFKKSVELNPDFAWANYYLGYIMINKFGKFEGCEYLKVALEKDIQEAQSIFKIACENQ